MELDLISMAAAVLQVQGTPPLTGTAVADGIQINLIATVVERIPLGFGSRLRILLPLNQGCCLTIAKALHIEGNRLVGQGGNAQRLQRRSCLTILLIGSAAAGSEAAADHQGFTVQKLLGILQLIQQNRPFYIVGVYIFRFGPQGCNAISIHTLGQNRVAVIGKQCFNFIGQSVILIDRDLRQAHITGAVPLAGLYCQRSDRHAGELDNKILVVLGRFIGNLGRGHFLLIDPNGKAFKEIPVSPAIVVLNIRAQIGNIDQVVHLIGLVELEGKLLVFPPGFRNPAGTVVPVVDRAGKLSLTDIGSRIGNRIGCRHDNTVVQPVDRGQIRCFYLLQFGCPNRCQRNRAVAPAIDAEHLNLIGHIVFQTGNNGGTLILTIQNRKCVFTLDTVLDPAVLGVLTRFPGDRQQRIPCRHCHIVGLVGNTAGLRYCPDYLRFAALPGLAAGSRHQRHGKIICL